MELPLFGGPAVWSHENRYVAVPMWQRYPRSQALAIFDVDARKQTYVLGHAAPMAIDSIRRALVRLVGADQHAFQPSTAEHEWLPWQTRPFMLVGSREGHILELHADEFTREERELVTILCLVGMPKQAIARQLGTSQDELDSVLEGLQRKLYPERH